MIYLFSEGIREWDRTRDNVFLQSRPRLCTMSTSVYELVCLTREQKAADNPFPSGISTLNTNELLEPNVIICGRK